MGFQVSPGVNVSEIDLTTIVPASSTTDGGLVHQFRWGPAYDITLVQDELELRERFGTPDANSYIGFFTAADFLAYGDKLRLVRAINEDTDTVDIVVDTVGTAITGSGFLSLLVIGSTITDAGQSETREIVNIIDDNNAVLDSAFTADITAGTVSAATYVGALNATCEQGTGSGLPGLGVLVRNDDHYDGSFSEGQADVGPFCARHPGAAGNSLKISICPGESARENRMNPASGSGNTVSTSGTILTLSGGTDLTTIVEVGSIVVAPTGEEASVVSVDSATQLTLDAPFLADLASVDAWTVKVRWEFYNDIRFPLGTSSYALARGGSSDELHVIVVDEDGVFSGIAGTVLERFILVSKASDAKQEDGTSNYYKERINRTSNYIRWMDHPIYGTNWGSDARNTPFTQSSKPLSISLTGGQDGKAITDANKLNGYDLLSDPETVDVSLVLGADASAVVATYIINNVCEKRLDCIALLSPPQSAVVNNPGSETEDIIAFRNQLPSSSYGVMDSGWKRRYDKYNDVFRYVPLNGDVGGLMVRTDTTRDPWYSPAGLNRGNIKNVSRLAFNPRKADRDDLYQNGINSVVSFPGEGTVLYGDKTMLAKPSAFDRINVRRLFIVLEKSIARAARYSLFEFNDSVTQAQFKALITPFLQDVQSRRGITAFQVVCDSRNNTPEVIDRNEFVGDIYIKPARSINFIQLNFIAVRTGVEFNEVIGNF